MPTDAVTIDVIPEPVPLVTLQDRIRPMQAGTQITMVFNQTFDTATCTYGPIVVYQNVRHMVTNSHCTQLGAIGGLVGAWAYQATTFSGDRYGTEVQDPPLSSFYGCPSGQSCRYSDAALIKVGYSGWFVDIRTDWGYLARPASRATLPSIYGSLTIDGSNPRLALSGTLSSLYVGDTLEKVGRTTGWTAGEVTSTNSNISLSDGTRLQNVTVRAGVGRGDSGSPVFFRGSSGLYFLAGLLWGGNGIQPDGVSFDTFYYSKWSNVDYELGTTLPDLDPVP